MISKNRVSNGLSLVSRWSQVKSQLGSGHSKKKKRRGKHAEQHGNYRQVIIINLNKATNR